MWYLVFVTHGTQVEPAIVILLDTLIPISCTTLNRQM